MLLIDSVLSNECREKLWQTSTLFTVELLNNLFVYYIEDVQTSRHNICHHGTI